MKRLRKTETLHLKIDTATKKMIDRLEKLHLGSVSRAEIVRRAIAEMDARLFSQVTK